jgi:hypothetical protein
MAAKNALKNTAFEMRRRDGTLTIGDMTNTKRGKVLNGRLASDLEDCKICGGAEAERKSTHKTLRGLLTKASNVSSFCYFMKRPLPNPHCNNP